MPSSASWNTSRRRCSARDARGPILAPTYSRSACCFITCWPAGRRSGASTTRRPCGTWRLHEPSPPRRIRPELPRDLETICLTCLEKDPGRRYASARELADDLRRWLGGESIAARPLSPMRRAGRWCRRNPVAASLAGGLAVTVAASFLILLSLLHEARTQERILRANHEAAPRALRDAMKWSRRVVSPATSAEEDRFEHLFRDLRSHLRKIHANQGGDPASRDLFVEISSVLAERINDQSPDEAEKLLHEAEEVLGREPGPSDSDPGWTDGKIRILVDLGVIASRRRRLEVAESLYREAVERLASLGPGSLGLNRRLQLMKCRNELGALLRALHRDDESKSCLEELPSARIRACHPRRRRTLPRSRPTPGRSSSSATSKAPVRPAAGQREPHPTT